MIRLRESCFFIRQFLLETSNFSLCLGFKILFLDQYFLKFFKSYCSIISGIYSFELTQIKLTRRTFFDQVIEFDVRIISFFESQVKLSHDLLFCYIFSSCFLVELKLDLVELKFLSFHHSRGNHSSCFLNSEFHFFPLLNEFFQLLSKIVNVLISFVDVISNFLIFN